MVPQHDGKERRTYENNNCPISASFELFWLPFCFEIMLLGSMSNRHLKTNLELHGVSLEIRHKLRGDRVHCELLAELEIWVVRGRQNLFGLRKLINNRWIGNIRARSPRVAPYQGRIQSGQMSLFSVSPAGLEGSSPGQSIRLEKKSKI